MSRMPQKLLINSIILFIFILSTINYAIPSSLKLKISIDKGPNGKNLYHPLGIYYDQNKKRLYVADTGNNRLVSFKIDGTPLKSFDAGGQLKKPYSMTKGNTGLLWVVERDYNSITLINLKTKNIKRQTLTYKGQDVLIDRFQIWNNLLAILDRASGKILFYNENLVFIKAVYPREEFKGFFDFKIKNNILWGLENMTGRIFGLDIENNKTIAIIQPSVHLSLPVSLEVDNLGNFYILDRYQKKVFIIDQKGKLQHELFKKGYLPGKLNNPWQLLIFEGNLLVLDEGNGRVDIWGH